MKNHFISASLILSITMMAGAAAVVVAATAAEPGSGFGKRPNVILIYSDDQGSLDLGYGMLSVPRCSQPTASLESLRPPSVSACFSHRRFL